jgi:hypothetical protein
LSRSISLDKYIFLFSKKGKQFDIQQLKKNLLKLIEKSNVDNNQLDHTDQLIQFLKDNPRNVIGRNNCMINACVDRISSGVMCLNNV